MKLEDVRPKTRRIKVIFKYLIAALTIAVFAASYRQTEVDLFKLFTKRDNAISYIFGKKLDDEDREDALRQAKLYPELMSREEARVRIRDRYRDIEGAPSWEEQEVMIEELAEKLYKKKSVEQWREFEQDEYKDILKDKKGGYFPPESDPGKVMEYLSALVETISIAIWGSLLAFLTALPAAFLAAKNTLLIIVPGENRSHRAIRWFGQFVVRRFLDICRGFNEFVMALIFVAIIGLGPFAGVLALWIHTFGILGKVFSESIEAVDHGPIEGVQATGAGVLHTLGYAIIPQIMPSFISYGLLRFETNVRSATILGFCGAGGIGFLMFDKINGYLYREVATMMIIVIFTVSILDYLTGCLRRKFI
ncbi:MAG: phosphonate ABC transporter, permease protein PhnE [Bacteriovoracaceae bacterium]|nr:phosphonate ABC transporter, permease protein PhnE [Bacteriovoracaceae bacterium]